MHDRISATLVVSKMTAINFRCMGVSLLNIG
jgi:hypothetical protein